MTLQRASLLGWILVAALLGCEKKPEGTPEERAVAAVKKAGGSAVVDKNNPDQPVIQINLRETSINDEGLQAISVLARLEELDLTFCRKVTDQGIAHLRKMTGLRNLTLWNIPLTDRSLEHIAVLENLENLNLGLCPVTDDGIKFLARLTRLKQIDLSSTRVTEACLSSLKASKELRYLYLQNIPITDTGLQLLHEFKQLEEINLIGTNVTDGGVQKLMQALPQLKVIR